MKSKLSVVAVAVSLVACGGGGSGGGSENVSTSSYSSTGPAMVTGEVPGIKISESALGPFSLLGTVQGLTGSGLLLDSGHSRANVSPGYKAFGMLKDVPANAEYNVVVREQPVNPTQICTVVNGHGIAKSIVTDIAVNCVSAAKFAVVVQKNAQGGAIQTFAYDQTTGNIGEKSLKSEPLFAAESNGALRVKLIRNPKKSAVYLISEETNSIASFKVNEKDGTLTKNTKYAKGAIRSEAAINSAGTKLYSLVPGTETIVVHYLGLEGEFLDGTMTASDENLKENFTSIKVHPDGKHVYISTANGVFRVMSVSDDDIFTYDGSLVGYTGMNGLALSPAANFAYVSMDNTSAVGLIRLNAKGKIESEQVYHFAGKISNLKGLTIDPTGNFMFGLDTTLNAVVSFKLDQTTGEPTFVGSVPVDANASSEITIDPQGRFVYLSALNTGGFVRGFSIDQKTGALTALSIMQTGFGSTHAIQLY